MSLRYASPCHFECRCYLKGRNTVANYHYALGVMKFNPVTVSHQLEAVLTNPTDSKNPDCHSTGCPYPHSHFYPHR